MTLSIPLHQDMQVLNIKEQEIGVSVSAASGSSSDDETAGHATPASTSTDRDAKTGSDELFAKHWTSALSDQECVAFPTVPRSVNALSPDQVVKHRLSSLHGASNVNVQSIIHAAWALVAGQMTGSQDIVFGVSMLTGNIIENVPLRLQWSRDQHVRSFLLATQKEAVELSSPGAGSPGKIRQTCTEATQAFEFQTLVTFWENYRNVSIERKPAGRRYALELDVLSRYGEYVVSARSDSRVISAWLVDRLLLRLDRVVTQLCSYSLQQTIGEVNLMTGKDVESIWDWNREVPETLDCCVHSIIEDKVRANPGAPAICAWDGNLTYAELNDRAAQVAERLSATGLRPGSVVPLCFDKSVWANIAMLGVLKAGGALVMLDPMLPEERLKSIVEQVDAELIVSCPSNYELSLRLCDKVEVVRPQDFDSQYQSSRPLAKLCPSSIAYVQFTSGSTGVPKGSAISHRSISSAIHHQLGPIGFNSRSRVYDFSSYSFDLSIYNALTTLSAGGCLCVPTDSGRKDDLTGSILSLRANTLTLTPSTAQTLHPEQLPDVKTIVFAGEALRVQDAAPWWKQARVVNIYGPSECTPVSTMSYNCESPAQVIDIGKGVGMNTWIVDAHDHQRLLPPGCIGELVLEGPLVSAGYLGNADSNAKTYIKDPAWLLRGCGSRHVGRHGRLYKTGDLVRYNEDGGITFVARKDTQVKIRGQRVELGEVETRMQECLTQALQVAAEVITPQGSNPMLVAFILQNDDAAKSPNALELYHVPADFEGKIANKLPPYMIPAVYLSVNQMPVTASGKLDRKQLREIGTTLSPEKLAEMGVGRGVKKPPSTDAERQVQRIWGQVLKFKDLEVIGAEDNFFQLGGDSVTAMKIVRSLRELGLELSVADVLGYPVLKDIAERIVDVKGEVDDIIPPYSLLPEGCDIISLLQGYQLDPSQVQDVFPCTAIQEGLVSLSSQRSGDYVTQAILDLSPEVSIERFCHTWSTVVEAIPLLRTRFVQGDTGLLQVVLDEKVSWRNTDNLQVYLDTDRKQPMRLGASCTRFALVNDATGRVTSFVLTAHHALHDGYSLGLIMDTLDKVYTGGKVENFPSFQRFIQYVRNQDVDVTSEFWKKAMEGCESVPFPSLPSSIEKPTADTWISNSLRSPPSNSEATTTTVIRAAWALVVGCMVNSDDVVFGVTVSGRHAEVSGIDKIPGPTIATVPMRFNLLKSQTIASFLQKYQNQAIDIIPHEQLGLTGIAKLSSDCEQACGFQTLLVIQPEEDTSATRTLGRLREENSMQWSSTYGLVLEIQLGKPQSTITASFDSRLIDRPTVESLLGRLQFVLDQVASAGTSSAKTLKDISVLTPTDFDTLMTWNAVVPETIDMCIHEAVNQQAIKRPDQPAVCAWDGKLTYNELDTLSTNLAGQLASIGVQEGTIVPLCFEKSMWTPVAMLAVLKVGGAFLLLDPSLPQARLEVMVKHVDAELILAAQTCTQLSCSLVEKVITVDAALLSSTNGVLDDSKLCSDSSSKAYIIFTSGSTGTPKGVVITHSNVVSAVTQHSKALEYDETSRIYDFSSYSFGASLNNMFCALTSGACLCIPNDDDRKSNLAESLTSLGATDVLLTPSSAEHLSPESVPTLRSLILGGEAVRAQDGNQWLGHVRLRTAYGQSETTTIATINPHPATAEQAMSIGSGVGLVTWVVDPENHQNLLPPGSIGELLVEGPAVGHGYFKDPKKTDEVFISDPHWLIKAGRRGRLYKTGDLVRYNHNGTLAYLGRKDSQVKIRGQRIELGDVEYWVRELMVEADQVVVEAVTPKGPGGRPTLAAFIKISNAEDLFGQDDAAVAKLVHIDVEVEKMLRRQLPSYMVPTIFIAMKSLPMTPTGKMNRRELRTIGGGISAEEVRSIHLANNGPKRQPVTDKEHQMQQVWSQVLGIEQQLIDLNASFFQLGGDSIAAMRVAGAARKMGLGITVAEIFQHHTLRMVAEKSRYTSSNKVSIRPFALVGNDSDASELRRVISQSCRVDPEIIEDAYPCTPLQEGLFSLAFKRPGDYMMQAVLELSPKVDTAMFRKAWESAIGAAAVLRTRIVHDQNLDLIQVTLNEKPKWHEATGLDDYMQADRAVHMTLSTPLSRLALVKNDKGRVQWFVLSMHHALYDGWSLSLILDMVRDAYSGADLEEEAAFQPFINYVVQQVDDAKTSEYWQAELQGCEFAPYPALPASISQPISDTVVQHCVSRPKDSYLDVTPAILARAAWAIATSRVTNAQDVVFGVTVSGRNAPVMNIDKMPAPAFATVPVRIQTSPGQRVSNYLEDVQQQAITMIPFEQLGLHRITKISADAQQACSFQTLLLVQQQGTETFGESDLGRWQNRDQQEFFNPYALMVEVNLLETGDLSLKAIFDSRIISSWAVERLLRQFDSVVQQIERTRPRQTLGDISTMTEADLQQIWTWNRVVPEPAADTCLHQLVENQAKAYPERIAISAWDGEFSYKQLDQLSNRLAIQLVQAGIHQGQLIPLCFQKSKWTPIAVIAVLKAGGAFTLLDPSLPEQQLKTITDQLGPNLIISSVSEEALSSRLCAHTITLGPHLLEDPSSKTQFQPKRQPTTTPMFAVFTPDSTGAPIGALISHMNFASTLHHQLEQLGFDRNSRIFDSASYDSDIAVRNIFAAFVLGGCLCVPSQESRKGDVGKIMAEMRVTIANMTPSAGRLLSPGSLPDLETVIFTGGGLTTGDVQRWQNHVRVVNAYGPAECSIATINPDAKDGIHVGRGAGINTWVVDPNNFNTLLPPGSIGEILLEGPVVGLGYLNYPEKTASSFIHDPTWLVRGVQGQAGRSGRLYKTGDLVEYDEHGNLRFLGRKDSQVKSRGQSHGQKHRGIGSSFYAQTQDGNYVQEAVAKRHPETPLEHQLQQIWARALEIEPSAIGLDDNFFHLGGDSVAAIKVASEARKADITITVAELFQHPTLVEAAGQLASHNSGPVEKIAPFSLLASKVDAKQLATELASQIGVSVDMVQDAYQCTPLQVGLLSLSFKRPGDYVMQATIELAPGCDISRFKQAWETTVQMTPVLRTRMFHSQSAGLVQVVLDEKISWNESFESLDAYLQQDRDSSMDIGEPLARYCLIRDGSDKPKYFVWTMHHALYDGWSMKLIMEAINRAFRGEQNTSEWPQFQQFIKHLQDQDDEALERYWRGSLEGFDSTPYPEVPKSVTEQPVADSSVEHSFIHSRSKESGIMVATLVRAAWALVAGSVSNSSDVVFGVTLSGRNAPISGITNMPGPTITTVPVRIDTSSGQTVSSYLQKAQIQATTMISFEQYGLQRIARVSSDAQRATQFQTLLVVQPAGDDDFLIDESMGIFCDNKNQANWFNTQALLIEVTSGKDKITVSANFDSNVIPAWLVTRLLQRLEVVIQQLDCAGPGTTLDQIDSVELSEAERVKISDKTDPKSLRSFSVQDQTPENGHKKQPVTEAERELQAIWSQILMLDPSDIGLDDSLFQLGGDSISAMTIAGEARKIGIKLSVSDIFRTPTIRDLALRISRVPKGVSNGIMPVSHSDPVELSFAQGRLWFLEQLYPGLTWYLMPFAIRFRGDLQLDALEKSLQAIESRHDTLRSTFLTSNNVHFQQVHRFVPKKLTIIDIPADERSLSEALRKDHTTTFDLTHEAGWRVTVYRLGKEHHVLSVVMHHINSDGWSIQVFRKELVQLYSAAIKGHQLATQIRPLPVQYRDYSAWQKQKLLNGEYQRQLDYWTDKLQTSRPVEFLTDKQRPKTLSGIAGEHEFGIKGNMYDRILALCKEYAVTPFVILLAAFRATHYRMTRVEDATIGSPNANRDRSELKDMIGFFVNMLSFRLTVEDDSFESLVRQVHQQTVESFDNQDIPFEQIVFKLNQERDLSRHPIVQVVFAYHTRGTLDTVELDGVGSKMLDPPPTTRFDLELHFFEEANSLKGAFIYSTDLYPPTTITNMLSVFMAVLEGALSEPRSKIATLPLLTTEGYTELKSMGLLEIHQTNYPRDLSIVDVFQQQATAHPDKVAVKDSLSQITFATLDEKSDSVSRYLTTQGFSIETVIPVIAKRSVETIITFLGILKANMAYLPLDPKAPIERTKLVLSSIQGPTIILLGKSVRSPDIQDMKSIYIQSVLEHRVQSSFFQRIRAPMRPSASSLAYVLYTSGSTGKPKGVMVEHRSILRLVLQSNCTQYLTRNGAVAHMANTIFDASTLEIYGALLNGLTLVCLDHELVLDHVALQKAFSEERIGAAFFTPAHLKQILADSPTTLSQLDTLMVGGDRFDTEDCIQARRVVKGHIINGYGPTENTVFSTMYLVEERDSWANGLPIGRAISNSGAYVMDSQLRLQPLGVIGELVVTGDGLARGYTESQLNTDRFVTVDIGGQQMWAYRTGDMARFRPVDGLIEFFGRADAQVKIRGHRVELGEIEHALLGHGSVADAVALIHQGQGQEPQLYAFAAVPNPMVYERMEVDNTGDVKEKEEEKDEEAEHMQVWSGVFDGDKYVSIDNGQVLGRDFVGWTSMYDGAVIDRGEMNEWLDDTIAAMNQNLGAGHVLELGTGSGMILFNLIQGLSSYIGLDPSDRAVDYVSKAAQSIPSLANKTRVYKGTADQVSQLPGPITPNLVVCNSVAQYFPSQEYLFNVIDELVQKEGMETLFFGDMRSQAMYNEFCVTQVLSRSGDNISKADLRQSIADIGRKEMEFLVDPGFFTGLQSRLPEFIEHVEILPKNMVATNELSCYRYAAVIHVKRQATQQRRVHTIQKDHWVDFAEQGFDHSALVQRLRDSSPQTLPVSNIPYKKTIHERFIVEHLAKSTIDASSDQDDWVSSLRTAAQQCPSFSAYELKEIAKQTGYQVEISWARQFSLHGGFDAVFHRIEPDQEGTRVLFQFPNDHEGRPLNTMTSQPLLQQARQRVREELKARLLNHLPAYMIPKVITILDEMPVNANGKVDRKALVETLRTRTAPVRGEVREPNTKQEEKLQGIWARVLNISSDGIGLDDSFFQLGGDSITAMKVVNEARKLGIDLAVSDIFRSDNLEDLALQSLQHIGEADEDEEPVTLVDEVTKSALLRELDASGTSIRSDQVADILPLTSMQKRYITDGYTNGLFVHYFFLDFSLDLDIERLKTSLQQLLQSIPILRAAFLELKGKYWQVIPEVLDLPWVVRDVEESLSEALGDFCRADIKTVSFVEPPALFALLRNKTEGLRLVIRFSHAQYDGASFPAIIKPLIDGYFGRPTTTGPDYSAFLAYIVRRRPASIAYWKDLLQGSSLTRIQPHISTSTQVLKPTHVSVQSEVTLPSLPSKFTTATLASAAWALLLAHTTRGKDIVYGHIVTGRNARICGPEEPVGPCLNVAPVRATLSSSQTPRELLRLLQMQFSSMGDADSLGYEDIMENCTNWPAGTQFESLIHHANINEHPEFDFGEEKVKLEFFHNTDLLLDHIMVMSYPVGNRLQFNILANTRIMSVEVAQTMVNRLCTIVCKMGAALDEPIFKWLNELQLDV
jgi:amino acid adenylation domain-containing protein